MFHTSFHLVRNAMLATVVAAGLITTVAAQDSASTTGLGQAWPNAEDRSASPSWHVYVFKRDGIKYVQVNDHNGTVHAAMGIAGGTAFALPIGSDAQHVAVEISPTPVDSAQTVYRDNEITVTAESQAAGGMSFTMQAACGDPYRCTSQNVAAQ